MVSRKVGPVAGQCAYDPDGWVIRGRVGIFPAGRLRHDSYSPRAAGVGDAEADGRLMWTRGTGPTIRRMSGRCRAGRRKPPTPSRRTGAPCFYLFAGDRSMALSVCSADDCSGTWRPLSGSTRRSSGHIMRWGTPQPERAPVGLAKCEVNRVRTFLAQELGVEATERQ